MKVAREETKGRKRNREQADRCIGRTQYSRRVNDKPRQKRQRARFCPIVPGLKEEVGDGEAPAGEGRLRVGQFTTTVDRGLVRRTRAVDADLLGA